MKKALRAVLSFRCCSTCCKTITVDDRVAKAPMRRDVVKSLSTERGRSFLTERHHGLALINCRKIQENPLLR